MKPTTKKKAASRGGHPQVRYQVDGVKVRRFGEKWFLTSEPITRDQAGLIFGRIPDCHHIETPDGYYLRREP